MGTQGFSKMVAGSVLGSINRLSVQCAQPVFVAGTRVGIQAIPENSVRPQVVVPTNAGTQPLARQFVVARPLDRQGQGVATNYVQLGMLAVGPGGNYN